MISILDKTKTKTVETYIKVPNSLGFRDLNLSAVFTDFAPNQTSYSIENNLVESLQSQLLSRWRRLLYSNVQSIDLYDLSLNLTYTGVDSILANETILVVSYFMKLDPRISFVSQVIFKLLNIINSTLANPNSTIYSDILLTNSSGFLITNPLISCKFEFFFFRLKSTKISFSFHFLLLLTCNC